MRRYLIVGQTGAGKSSFINAVFGAEVAQSHPFEAQTKEVERFTYTTSSGTIELIDTPGLGEDNIDLDTTYLRMVAGTIVQQPIDVLIYVTRLDTARFLPSEKRTLQLITQHLGPYRWYNSWLVLTHAAAVPQERFSETVQTRFIDICLFIQETTQSVLKTEKSQFKHFKDVMVIDSLIPGWRSNAVPLPAIFER